MIASFVAYIASFVAFGFASGLAGLVPAMLLFGVGEAFRTGTHKAMIFDWLKQEGRTSERTAVYGRTRSWSKIGSALSVVIATAFVLATNRFAPLFFLAIVPYVVGIVNFLGYPRALDGTGTTGPREPGSALARPFRHLRESLATCWSLRPVRRLLADSMGYEGIYKASKDYLQPVLQAAAVPALASLSIGAALGEPQRAALLVGPVYVGLFLLSAVAARHAHRLTARLGDEGRASRLLWLATLGLWLALLPAMRYDVGVAIVVGFVVLSALQNLYRPILLARLDAHVPDAQQATVLSIENQAKSAATMVLAPLLGLAVDLAGRAGEAGRFWPVAAIAAAVCLFFSLARGPAPARAEA
jgi:hypothetical protein